MILRQTQDKLDKKLSKEEILHLAKLSKLKLTDEEINKFESQLGETIDYIKNLDKLDTKNVEPTNSVVNLENVGFTDGEENKKGLKTNEALANAKEKKNNMFVAERIM